MKVLHVFPQFGPELPNGSDRHEYLLSAKLAQLGVEVDVLTTQTGNSYHTSAFSTAWPLDYAQRTQQVDGLRIERFPVSFSLSPRMGYAISVPLLKRWRREERRYGLMLKGSRNLVDYYHRRAIERPRIYDLAMMIARGPYSFRLMARMVAIGRHYDVVQVGFTPYALNWQVMAIARALRKPVVLLALFHPDDIYHHFRAIYWCLNKADAILAQTPYSVELFRRLFPASKPIEAGVGIDLDEIQAPSVSGARFRARYGLDDQRIVLFVGRKERFKRYDLAIEAVEMLDDPRVRLVIVGRDIDGLPIAGRHVTYLGELSRSDLLDAYDACDVFLFPSEHESLGWVMLEAWARRRPVIANRACAAVSAVVEDGRDGFLCLGAAQMANRIAQIIETPQMGRDAGEAGYRKVARRYTWDEIGNRVRDLYLRLTAAQASTGAVARYDPVS